MSSTPLRLQSTSVTLPDFMLASLLSCCPNIAEVSRVSTLHGLRIRHKVKRRVDLPGRTPLRLVHHRRVLPVSCRRHNFREAQQVVKAWVIRRVHLIEIHPRQVLRWHHLWNLDMFLSTLPSLEQRWKPRMGRKCSLDHYKYSKARHIGRML